MKHAIHAPESELRRWRKTFDAHAKVTVGGEKCVHYIHTCLTDAYAWLLHSFLDVESFVDAIAPANDLSKLGRAQFATLFKVADSSKRGLVSWDDFTIFQTILKRPDADYWIAFKYFDVCVDVTSVMAFCLFMRKFQ